MTTTVMVVTWPPFWFFSCKADLLNLLGSGKAAFLKLFLQRQNGILECQLLHGVLPWVFFFCLLLKRINQCCALSTHCAHKHTFSLSELTPRWTWTLRHTRGEFVLTAALTMRPWILVLLRQLVLIACLFAVLFFSNAQLSGHSHWSFAKQKHRIQEG
jgi:hypothetical protein